MRLVVRGPAPSCRVLGVIRTRGKAGANKIVFAGRLHGRPLAPGVYSVTLARPAQRGVDTVLVRVVGPGHTIALPTVRRQTSDCESTFAPRQDSSFAFPTTSLGGTGAGLTSHNAAPSPRAKPAGKTAVLGVKASSFDSIRRFGAAGSGAIAKLPTPVGLALLIALVLAIAATMSLVVRFLRGSWNP